MKKKKKAVDNIIVKISVAKSRCLKHFQFKAKLKQNVN